MIKNVHFVVYDNRSGSTLLAALLHQFKGVNVTQECDFTHQILEYHNEAIESAVELSQFLNHMQNKTRFEEMKLSIDGFGSRIEKVGFPINKGQILHAFIEEYFARKGFGSETVVIKAPNLYFHLGALKKLYPESKFIHIFRDGRAVFASQKRSKSTKGKMMSTNPYTSAKTWSNKIKVINKFDNVVEVRYESLISNPEGEMASLLEKLKVESEERSLVREQSDYFNLVGDNQTHLHKNLLKKPDPSHSDKWRAELSATEIQVFQKATTGSLEKQGYPLVVGGSSNFSYSIFRLKHFGAKAINVFRYLFNGKLVYKLKFQLSRF